MVSKITSIRWRFVVTAIVLTALALPAIFYTQNLVQQASLDNTRNVQEHRDLGWVLSSLKDSLQVTESAIYQYPLLLSERAYRKVLVRLNDTKVQSKQLTDHYVVKRYQHFGDFAANLNVVLDRLEQETHHLLNVLSDVRTRFPAAPILLNSLYPMNQIFIQETELSIFEAEEAPDSRDQMEVLRLLKELRYAWAQQVSSVRIFVANRSGVFGQPESTMEKNKSNREMYAQRVEDLLIELQEYHDLGKLGFQQSLSLIAMRESKVNYDKDFLRAALIYTSPDWRADLPIFRNKIRPSLDQSWGILELMQEELDFLAQRNMMKTLATADTLSNIVWGFTAFMALLLLISYFMFDTVIRRPLLEVSKALDAAGRGETYVPVLRSPTKETTILVDAFRRMQGQVTSRQLRLTSILDNVAEGIITINEKGIIETFNAAAEKLFGYQAQSTVGSSVIDIIKFKEHGLYANFLELCQSPNFSGDEKGTTVTVLRNDGSTFPMSIKVNKLEVEGRRLYIAIVEDVGERMALMEHLREMAEHDSLTGLYNRQYLLTELERVVENVKRGSRRDLALLYIDLDNFKYVNDTLGHLAGDRVLVEVTKMLGQRNRKSDLLARLGGDEFAILLYDVEEEQVVQAAESHRKLLADYEFKYKGSVIQIGCSIGVALFGRNPITKEDLLVRADVACNIAKRSGRNRVHVYESVDKENMALMSMDMGWARKIKDAIEQDRFCLACQPIMELKTGEIFRHEVLLRMRDESGNLIMPSGFLSSGERFGLMRDIDTWVINNAFEYLGQQLLRNPRLHFSINLSAESIGDSVMLEVIMNALLRYNVPPTAITFEITETVAIANVDAAVEFLLQLRHLGCQTALDDFGVGYSSFAYLKDLPVDFVKIDGSFVRDVHRDKVQLAMVRSMNDIAHAMGKLTIAEFVDNKDCKKTLKEIGVDLIQGYYIGGPQLLSEYTLFQTESNVIRLV